MDILRLDECADISRFLQSTDSYSNIICGIPGPSQEAVWSSREPAHEELLPRQKFNNRLRSPAPRILPLVRPRELTRKEVPVRQDPSVRPGSPVHRSPPKPPVIAGGKAKGRSSESQAPQLALPRNELDLENNVPIRRLDSFEIFGLSRPGSALFSAIEERHHRPESSNRGKSSVSYGLFHRSPGYSSKAATETGYEDILPRCRELEDGDGVPSHHSSANPLISCEKQEERIVAWVEDDKENPYNWSRGKKTAILLTTMMLIVNSAMGSALPSNAIPSIAKKWGVTSQVQQVLPISLYLAGYVMGPVLWAPLSEGCGRRVPTLGLFLLFALFTLACAVAPTWAAFLLFRLFSGAFGSAPIAIVLSIISDIYDDPRVRGRNMTLFLTATLSAPLLAPIISGFSAPTIGWRWVFWIALIFAAVTAIPLFLFLPETNGLVLLQRRVQAIRKIDPRVRVVVSISNPDPQDIFQPPNPNHDPLRHPHPSPTNPPLKESLSVGVTRPVCMLLTDPLLAASCAYMAFCYAVFYMLFEAYPIIFQGVYGMSPGECGLVFLAVGGGCVAGAGLGWTWDGCKLALRGRESESESGRWDGVEETGRGWREGEEVRRLSLACVGGPVFAVSLFWMGWSAREGVHWVVPMLAGALFGGGQVCIFQGLLNYLTSAYPSPFHTSSAASAAFFSCTLLATLLPLATHPMFDHLGIGGAFSLLGGVSTLLCAVPFLFLRYGERLRRRSRFAVAVEIREEGGVGEDLGRGKGRKRERERGGERGEGRREERDTDGGGYEEEKRARKLRKRRIEEEQQQRREAEEEQRRREIVRMAVERMMMMAGQVGGGLEGRVGAWEKEVVVEEGMRVNSAASAGSVSSFHFDGEKGFDGARGKGGAAWLGNLDFDERRGDGSGASWRMDLWREFEAAMERGEEVV